MKRIIAVLLILTLLVGTVSACSSSNDKDYMIKGEFFSLIISRMNYYPIDYTIDEMNEADNYDIEAQTMVDWELLPEDAATDNLLKPVTKEIALAVLVNSMSFAKTGNIDDVKDAEMSDFPQEMADAVATGIVSVDKSGCVNAKQKLTYDECEDLISKTNEIESNGHFEDSGSIDYDFGDDTVVVTSDALADDPYFEVVKYGTSGIDTIDETASVSNVELEAADKPHISFLDDSDEVFDEEDSNQSTEEIRATVSKSTYELVLHSPKKGQNVVYDPYLKYKSANVTEADEEKAFAGKISEIIKEPLTQSVTMILEPLDDTTVMEATEIHQSSNKQNSKENNMQLLDENGKATKSKSVTIDGFTISFEYADSMYTVSASTPLDGNDELKVSASIGNFQVDLDNVKYLFNKSAPKDGSPVAKLTFDTKQSASYKFSGIIAPYDNRNGGFLSNLSNSKFNTSGKGAKAIKVGQVKIPFGQTGIYATICVYLKISIEGSVSITFSQTRGFELLKTGKHNVTIKPLYSSKKEFDIDATLLVALGADISLNFTLIKYIVVYNVEGYLRLKVSAKFCYDGQEQDYASAPSPDPDEGLDSTKLNLSVFKANYDAYKDNASYSMDMALYVGFCAKFPQYTTIGNHRNLLYKVLPEKVRNALSYNTDGEEDFKIWSAHFSEPDDASSESSDESDASLNRISLEKTKIHVPNGCCGIVKITDIPNDDKTTIHKSNLHVRVEDTMTVSAEIIEWGDGYAVQFDSNEVGSTEIEVYYKANKTTEEMYSQQFSATIESSESPIEDISVINDPILTNSGVFYI